MSTKINNAKITHHASRASMTPQVPGIMRTNHELSKGSLARTIRTNPDQFTSDTCHHKCRVFVGGFILAGAEVRKKQTRDKRSNIQSIRRHQRQMHGLSSQLLVSIPGSLLLAGSILVCCLQLSCHVLASGPFAFRASPSDRSDRSSRQGLFYVTMTYQNF